MGLGLHGGGVSSAAFFARLGAKVVVTDLKSGTDLRTSLRRLKKFTNIEYVLCRHRLTDFKKTDLIIRNPAVPNDSLFLETARRNKIPVHTDVSWFLAGIKNKELIINNLKIIGITGTKGKSTTASLLQHVLTACGQKSLLVGNIRQSPLDYLSATNLKFKIKNLKFVIIELSSWHLESLAEHRISPEIALITNIMRDHLNRYPSFSAYQKAKQLIYKYQTPDDVIFLNKNDRVSEQLNTAGVKSKIIWYETDAVLAIAKYLQLDQTRVRQTIKSFPGIPGRLQLIATKAGVKYYNDTCATQPDATVWGMEKLLKSGDRKIILIAGGEDKKLKFDALAKMIAQHVKTLVLFKGSASDKITKSLQHFNPSSLKLRRAGNLTIQQFNNVRSMNAAVKIASTNASPNDIVLLSPAAASFGLFQHEFDRGDQFNRAVARLRPAQKT